MNPYPIRPAAEVDPTGAFEAAYQEVSGMSGHGQEDAKAQVKPLEWRNYSPGEPAARALTLLGVYSVDCHGEGDWFATGPDGSIARKLPSHHEALEAAQADYERRILSALRAPAEAEPVAWRVTLPVDDYYGTGPDRLQFHPLSQSQIDAGETATPLYAAPPPAPSDLEQAMKALELLLTCYARKRPDGLPLDISEQPPEIAEAMRVLARYKVREAGL